MQELPAFAKTRLTKVTIRHEDTKKRIMVPNEIAVEGHKLKVGDKIWTVVIEPDW